MTDNGIAAQTAAFLQSMALGAVGTLLFCLTEGFGRLFLHRVGQFIAEVLFFVGFGVITFLFLLAVADGTVRAYLLLGEGFGSILLLSLVGFLRQKGKNTGRTRQMRRFVFRMAQRKKRKRKKSKKFL